MAGSTNAVMYLTVIAYTAELTIDVLKEFDELSYVTLQIAKIFPVSHKYKMKGEAICFDAEEESEEAILAGKVHKGYMVGIRYEGTKGGSGMRKVSLWPGDGCQYSLITDGQFSGTDNSCVVGHISPEAMESGPVAIVCEGDKITIDVDSRSLELNASG